MDTEVGAVPAEGVTRALVGLSSPHWPVRLEAVDTLRGLLERDLEARERKRVRAPLLGLLTDGSWKVRQALALALGTLPPSPEVQDALTALSGDENRYVQEAATRARQQKQGSGAGRTRVIHRTDPVFQAIRAEVKRLSVGTSAISESTLYETAERVAEVAYRAVAADATHELNTVLATIDGYAEQLVESIDQLGPRNEQVALRVTRLKERTRFARRIGEDLRCYASPGTETREEVPAEVLLREAISLAQERAHQSGSAVPVRVREVPEVRPTVLRSRMVRALSNVICNALEASPVTQVSLAVELDPGAVCFLIEDDGCGMTEDQLAAATRCFTTNKRAVGGTGMGLAIVQRVVEGEHRGRLELASAVDEGTRVRVVLPMAQGEGGSEGVG